MAIVNTPECHREDKKHSLCQLLNLHIQDKHYFQSMNKTIEVQRG